MTQNVPEKGTNITLLTKDEKSDFEEDNAHINKGPSTKVHMNYPIENITGNLNE